MRENPYEAGSLEFKIYAEGFAAGAKKPRINCNDCDNRLLMSKANYCQECCDKQTQEALDEREDEERCEALAQSFDDLRKIYLPHAS
jgi:hypothetical protein